MHSVTVGLTGVSDIGGNYALPVRLTLCDVGPRDGLQNEPETLAPCCSRGARRGGSAAAGLPRIEAVSFVRDDRVPQMAGAEEVVAAADRGGAELSGLVLNARGWERFKETSLDRVNVTFAATEAFNRANGNAVSGRGGRTRPRPSWTWQGSGPGQ